MKTIIIKFKTRVILKSLLILGILTSLYSCDDFLEPDDPFGQIPYEEVFEDEATATAAVTTLYAKMRDEVLLTGNTPGLSVMMGLYADELDFYGQPWEPPYDFYQHQIISSNTTVQTMWNNAYNLIYMANAAIEGLEGSALLSDGLKNQLLGECLFVRAFIHFHLLTLFGDIPYIISTDYQINKDVSRLAVPQVYDNLLSDLHQAKLLLDANYTGAERTRANKAVISALLSRIYLYQGNWTEAESESSLLINNATHYTLESQLENEFLVNSRSAILQFKPKDFGSNTHEASTFIFSSVPPPYLALTSDLAESFEENDLRKIHWINAISDGTQTWYHANKYKANTNTGVSVEYSIVFRLAEQYLIRAEARARQNNLSGAVQDLNSIRNRAGLDNATAGTQNEHLDAILNERKWELFTEHGHRWFDIKRFEVAGQVLGPLKPNWKETNILLPIPEAELLINPNLAPQNPGY